VSEGAADRLGGAVPAPAFAFLLTLISLSSLFWLVTLKRTTLYTAPELWLMSDVVPVVQRFIQDELPAVHWLLLAISGLGSGWFVALGFAALGLLALAKGRRDLALILAIGTLCFPIEWLLKYFTSPNPISFASLGAALFDVGGHGLDDIADFPAGHALRASVLYGLAAFCVARLAPHRKQGMIAYAVAAVLIGAISLTRIYLGAHYPLDVLGGWMAGGALVSIIVAVHVAGVARREELAAAASAPSQRPTRRVAVPRRPPGRAPTPAPAATGGAGGTGGTGAATANASVSADGPAGDR
jgi:membrane-associated phospholipid phosphatase